MNWQVLWVLGCADQSAQRSHICTPYSLYAAKVNSWLQAHSQSRSSHEMFHCLRKRVNIFSLLLIVGWFFKKPHQRHASCQQCPSADLLLPYQQASAQAWLNWVSCHPCSPGLVRGGMLGCWQAWNLFDICLWTIISCQALPTGWQSACIARGATMHSSARSQLAAAPAALQ